MRFDPVRVLAIVLCCVPLAAVSHGDLHEQIDQLSNQIGRDSRNADLYLKRGELYRLHKEWDEALADYDAAAKLNSELRVVQFLRGRALQEAGRSNEALEALTNFLSHDPAHVEALIRRARVHAVLNDVDAAVKDLGSAIASTSEPSPEMYFERSRILLEAGPRYFELALRGLDEGIAKFGPLVSLQAPALDLEIALKRFDAALIRVDRIAKQSPRRETWLARRAEVLLLAGRRQEAKKCLDDALTSIYALPRHHRDSKAIRELEGKVRRLREDAALGQADPKQSQPNS